VVDDDNEFEPGVHFIEADLGELAEVTQRYLADPSALIAIREEAYRLICARHTWDHRVTEILADLQV
jgi:spore maturation protein CgeB